MSHSRLAPSAADRWVECPASVALSEQFPQLLEHPSAPEGVAAHWVASSMLTTHVPLLGDIAPNGIAVTEEMIDGALLYYNHVFKLANPHGGVAVRFRWEQTEHMPSIHPEMFGTPDGAGVVDTLEMDGILHVVDYKFGYLEVDPTENWQLVSYVRGVLDRLKFDGLAEQHIRVHLHIVQPRCYTSAGPIRTWCTTAANLRAMWNRLKASAYEALGDRPSYKVGRHCDYCPGRRACPELKRYGDDLMDRAEYAPPIELPPDSLGLQLMFVERSIALLEARASGYREQVEANIRAGQAIPGWGMKPGQASVRWNADLDELLAMCDLMGVNLRKSDPNGKYLPTPKQAAKLFEKAGVDSSVIDAYSEITPGGLKLVPASETLAAKAFGVKTA